jgi:hypothetical protein
LCGGVIFFLPYEFLHHALQISNHTFTAEIRWQHGSASTAAPTNVVSDTYPNTAAHWRLLAEFYVPLLQDASTQNSVLTVSLDMLCFITFRIWTTTNTIISHEEDNFVTHLKYWKQDILQYEMHSTEQDAEGKMYNNTAHPDKISALLKRQTILTPFCNSLFL